MRYLILDTETNALPDYKLPADHPSQPRMASFAGIVTDESLIELEDQSFVTLVKPDGWEMTEEAGKVNGLTTELCAEKGLPVADILRIYSEMILAGHIVVAYNAQHDCKILRGELRRAGMPDLFEQTPNICAMRSCGGLGIAKAGEKKNGFPKLSDAYRHFYGADPEGVAHEAFADARTCLMVFRKLVEIGAAKAPEVHYAKVDPRRPA